MSLGKVPMKVGGGAKQDASLQNRGAQQPREGQPPPGTVKLRN